MVRNANSIINTARYYQMLREDPPGSNDGAKLRSALAATPFEPGQPWCYYFALACVIRGFLGVENIPPSVLVTGSCQAAADHAAALGKLSEFPATGSIFLLKNVEGHFHHAGLVTSVDESDALVNTIEGNTNHDGSTEGYGVFWHTRKFALLRFIIW